ncbi:MAG TPA: hypothetical protein EYG86_00295 [Crocinitomicaceae bacterium]|nr:hypothetical protein [Crocinitomicaceae bacterium]
MLEQLEKYKSNGHFIFSPSDELSKVCNAPKNGIGVYTVYARKNEKNELVYIGSSGKVKTEGKPIIRKGGIFDRLVNGIQFAYPRKKSWKQKLIDGNIDALDIYWYETFDNEHSDIPSSVEGNIIQTFFNNHKRLPSWNKEF